MAQIVPPDAGDLGSTAGGVEPLFMSPYRVPSSTSANSYDVLVRPGWPSRALMVATAPSDNGTRRGTPHLVWSSRISRRARSMAETVRLNSSSFRRPVATASVIAGSTCSAALASKISGLGQEPGCEAALP